MVVSWPPQGHILRFGWQVQRVRGDSTIIQARDDPTHVADVVILIFLVPFGKLTVCYWKWPIYSWFTQLKWWFSIAMLVYQRVFLIIPHYSSYFFGCISGIDNSTVSFRFNTFPRQNFRLQLIFAVCDVPRELKLHAHAQPRLHHWLDPGSLKSR